MSQIFILLTSNFVQCPVCASCSHSKSLNLLLMGSTMVTFREMLVIVPLSQPMLFQLLQPDDYGAGNEDCRDEMAMMMVIVMVLVLVVMFGSRRRGRGWDENDALIYLCTLCF